MSNWMVTEKEKQGNMQTKQNKSSTVFVHQDWVGWEGGPCVQERMNSDLFTNSNELSSLNLLKGKKIH